MVKKRRFGRGPSTALSMDRDCDPLENVKVLSSTLGTLYLATALWLKAVSCAYRIVELGRTRFTSNCASRNLKTVLDSAYLFIR